MITVLIKYWKALLVIVWLVAFFAFGYVVAANYYKAKIATMEAEAKQAELDMIKIGAQNAMNAALLHEARTREQEPIVREVIKWRTKYEKVAGAGKCDLPNEFVRIHDTAATGVPATSSGTPDGASGITDVEALGTVTDNYALCRKWREQLNYVRELYGDGKDL